jgi:hypothetical protein
VPDYRGVGQGGVDERLRGWPTMVLLAAAYALLEEGPIDQMLSNPHCGGFDMGAAYASTYIPALGTSRHHRPDRRGLPSSAPPRRRSMPTPLVRDFRGV